MSAHPSPAGCAKSDEVTSHEMTVVREQQQAGDVMIDSRVGHRPTIEGAWRLAVTLNVALPSVANRAKATRLVPSRLYGMPVWNATRGNIDVKPANRGRLDMTTGPWVVEA